MLWLAVGSLIIFFLILILVQGKKIQLADISFSRKVIAQRQDGLTRMFLFFTKLGKALPTIFLCLLLVLFTRTRETVALNVGITIMLTTGLTYIIKRIFKRERPRENRLVEEQDHSFPSGHASTAAAFYMGLFLNGYLYAGEFWWLVIPALIISFLIGFSRVYLGIHYFTDILGGWFLGLAIVFLVPLLMN
ncbi:MULTISPECIES: phosphatase PAP2 family protein [Enterococcus]|uniref:Undecaprenyl-diphosphatase n=1 Tax=Candidatus Enterococcus ferrettii TaxID=2815324 RepID=A0ABV0EK27_9ENTE|nr:phosphatase PAP2 family protein [Enterococcus sp. 665A]MBO1338317.1 phosphatase PAP2 family protein [Enterococcus sp. 665A]